VGEVVVRVCGLAALELGVQRQRGKPCLGRVTELADRRARIGEQKPSALFLVAEHLGDPVGPACEQLGRQPRLESLRRGARLEPDDAVADRNAQRFCSSSNAGASVRRSDTLARGHEAEAVGLPGRDDDRYAGVLATPAVTPASRAQWNCGGVGRSVGFPAMPTRGGFRARGNGPHVLSVARRGHRRAT
jgi:hypothetical protein